MDYLEMIKQLYAVDKPKGYNQSDIDFVKSKFNALPKVVEEFWRTAGCTPAIHHVQDQWIGPDNIRKFDWLKENDYLILLNENQGCCRAVILKSDLEKDNPPVYITIDDEELILCTETTSEFIKAALAYESIFSFKFCEEEDFVFWITEEELDIIETKLEKKPFMMHGWMHMDMSFYSNAPDNMVVVMDCDDLQVIYGAASEKSYDKLMEVMEGLGEN